MSQNIDTPDRSRYSSTPEGNSFSRPHLKNLTPEIVSEVSTPRENQNSRNSKCLVRAGTRVYSTIEYVLCSTNRICFLTSRARARRARGIQYNTNSAVCGAARRILVPWDCVPIRTGSRADVWPRCAPLPASVLGHAGSSFHARDEETEIRSSFFARSPSHSHF